VSTIQPPEVRPADKPAGKVALPQVRVAALLGLLATAALLGVVSGVVGLGVAGWVTGLVAGRHACHRTDATCPGDPRGPGSAPRRCEIGHTVGGLP